MAIFSYSFRTASSNEDLEVAEITADAKCNIYICSIGYPEEITFRLAVSTASPSPEHFIIHDYPLRPNSTFVLNDILIKSGDKIWINTSYQSLSVRVEGQELV
jgi:hypothetical protein